MPIATRLTDLLGAQHPILLAPMDLVSDGRLAAAVSRAGGFGILGGGYGDEAWLVREMGHAWSGGDPRGTHTYPAGPPATERMLDFLLPAGR